MARLHGRRGRLYVGLLNAAAAAEPVAFLREWEITFASDDVEVTAFGDTNKVYVAGLPDIGGSYSGWYDDATGQLYAAATDGIARKFYLYTNNDLTTQYWYGTASFDMSVSGAVDGGVSISGDWKANSPVLKVG